MKNAIIGAMVLVSLVAGCSKLTGSKDEAAKDGGSASTASSTSTTGATGAGSIVDKALSFLGAGPFEGAITMNMTNAAGKSESMTYEVKGDKMRFDRPAGPEPGYVIIDGSKATSVDDAKKIAIVMDMSSAPMPATAAPVKKPTIEKTGKTETVAGYSCEDWKVTEDNGSKTDACVAKGIAFPSMGRAKDWTAELLAEKYFPLKAVTSDSTGKEKSRMEVTKIEKKSLDDSRFQVPAGYKVENMEDMMKAMGAAMGRHH